MGWHGGPEVVTITSFGMATTVVVVATLLRLV
jgi:hypothetical protein